MDGRKFSHQALEEIRKLVVERVKDGIPASTIARVLGFSLTGINNWLKLEREGGERALEAKPIPGRPSKLSEGQCKELFRKIRSHTPYDFGFDSFLWNLRLVQQVLRKEMGISLHASNVSRQLHSLGLSPQKPSYHAHERDAKEVRKWKEETYPALMARVRKERATLYFLDEAGFRTTDLGGRTWGEKGRRPVVEKTGQNWGVNVISAVNPNGNFRFMVLDGNFNAAVFGEFLDRLMKRQVRKLYLVLDNHPAHLAASIAKQVKGYRGRLELIFLPGYSPDVNPDEGIWSLTKPKVREKDVGSKEEFKEAIREVFRPLTKLPGYLRSIFKSPEFAYAANSS